MSYGSRGSANDDPRRRTGDESDETTVERDIDPSALDPAGPHTPAQEAALDEQVQVDEEQVEQVGAANAAAARRPASPGADRYVMPEDEAVDDEAADDAGPGLAEAPSLDADPLGEREAGTAADHASLGPTSDTVTRQSRGRRRMGHIAEHESDDWWRTWLGRTTVVLAGVFLLATGLAWAWVGGMHAPEPRNVPVAVISGDVGANALMNAVRLNGDALEAVRYSSAQAASDALARRKVDAILSSDATTAAGGFNLSVASGAGPGVADTVATAVNSVTTVVSVPLTVEDLHPVSDGDPRGLTPFYLMMAWILGGLVAAVALGVAIGTVPRDLDRLGLRLGALAAFSLLLGLLGALFAGPILGVWNQHTFGLFLTGALITFTAALVASALQSWLGLWGVGIAAVLLVVLGVPASGGIVTSDFLPGFFRGMASWIPNGSAVNLIRGLEYFGRSANTWPIVGLTLWSLGSILALVGATAVLGRRERAAGR